MTEQGPRHQYSGTQPNRLKRQLNAERRLGAILRYIYMTRSPWPLVVSAGTWRTRRCVKLGRWEKDDKLRTSVQPAVGPTTAAHAANGPAQDGRGVARPPRELLRPMRRWEEIRRN